MPAGAATRGLEHGLRRDGASVQSSRLQRPIKKRQAHSPPVVGRRVRVVELFIGVLDAVKRQLPRQYARPEVQVVLVTPATIKIDTAQRPEVLRSEERRVGK